MIKEVCKVVHEPELNFVKLLNIFLIKSNTVFICYLYYMSRTMQSVLHFSKKDLKGQN